MVADAAYATCLRLARRHYENFPVASRLLPAAMRPHIAAVYAFARLADDIADEGDAPADERLALLDVLVTRLRAAVSHPAQADGSEIGDIFAAVGDTIRRFDLDIHLFEDLLSAFRQDVLVSRYETWEALLDYCRRSANPVGRIVLRIHGHRDETADRESDAICTALQLANFWQDLERDWRHGRLYVPLDLLTRHGAQLDDLDRGRLTDAWRASFAEASDRTRALFEEGRALPNRVHGRLRWELRATWLGGMRILTRAQAARGAGSLFRPTLGWSDVPLLTWRMMRWSRP